MIKENVGGNVHLIQTQESYLFDFYELREQNHNEMSNDYLPPLVDIGMAAQDDTSKENK